MGSYPPVSVLMPVYNGLPFLGAAIESIINQTYRDWHLVVVNDGSTDHTQFYLETVGQRLGKKLTVIWHPHNLGIVHALNLGLELCHGEYIARMDADDIAYPRRFEKQLGFLEENGQIDGCGSWIEFFGDDCRTMEFPVIPTDVRDGLFERTTVPHPTYFFRRRIYDAFRYDPSYHYAEDVDFLLRVTERFWLTNIPEVLLRYRADYKRCRSCEDVEAQRKCVERAREMARRRRANG